MTKIYNSAAVIIPPKKIWPPIERIRIKYDTHVGRWMPHITLLYPFKPLNEFAALKNKFMNITANISPFEISLDTFKHFKHRNQHYTLWLNPEPNEPIIQLQKALNMMVPECGEITNFKGGFKPHLSVGQFCQENKFRKQKAFLQKEWIPIHFMVKEICLIWREPHKDSRFKIEQRVPLSYTICKNKE